MDRIKIGLDLHGVIDQDPNFFATLSFHLRSEGHEVHILTGRELCDSLIEQLHKANIGYNKIFSITSYHKEIGTHVSYKDDDPNYPLIAPPKWDRTKADYAERVGLDLHIDDSPIYGKFFEGKTQYLLYTPQIREILMILMGWTNKLDYHLKTLPGLFASKGAVNL